MARPLKKQRAARMRHNKAPVHVSKDQSGSEYEAGATDACSDTEGSDPSPGQDKQPDAESESDNEVWSQNDEIQAWHTTTQHMYPALLLKNARLSNQYVLQTVHIIYYTLS
jgi:hypothetical protein